MGPGDLLGIFEVGPMSAGFAKDLTIFNDLTMIADNLAAAVTGARSRASSVESTL